MDRQYEPTMTNRASVAPAEADPLARILDRPSAETAVRKRPTQARGIATFNAILDAAARLLQEGSFEILNTNLVAEVAGVNIATLYQYFPSKEAILLELFRRDTDERMAAGLVALGEADGSSDWRALVSDTLEVLIAHRRSQPATAALRRAMRSLPELQAYERETMLAGARFVSAMLTRGAGIEPDRAELKGLCLMETVTALLDLWSLGYARDDGARDDRIIEELKSIVVAYLAPLLDR
jgi:AcrR family transcriptional regulator